MSEATNFLYPFIESDERDASALLLDLKQSANAKVLASAELRRVTLQESKDTIDAVAAAMSDRFARGARLFVFGNGGSSTDAASLAALFIQPPWGLPLPARNLVDDSAVLTALGNDVGFDLVFSRQLIAHAGLDDIAIGLSTSGNSRNLLESFAEAARRGMLTIGIAGYSGGEMARSPDVQHCLVVNADSVHRIQETQAALGFALWQAVESRMPTMPKLMMPRPMMPRPMEDQG
ncbi:MAG: SIS domain-containing protein [Ilumatobacteraceae bacterium]